MTIVRYEPWTLVNRLHQTFDQFFSDSLEHPRGLQLAQCFLGAARGHP